MLISICSSMQSPAAYFTLNLGYLQVIDIQLAHP